MTTLLKKIMRVLQIVVICVVLAELAYYALLVPYARITKIVVSTALPLEEQDVLKMAKLQSSVSYFDIDTEEIEASLTEFFHIRSAEVSKEFPRTLYISLEERRPLAMLLAQGVGAASVPAIVDEQGVIFEMGAGVSDWNMPVLSGISFASFSVGSRMPEDVVVFLEDLHACKLQYPDLYNSISEYTVVQRDNRHYEVLIYSQYHGPPVRFSLPFDYRRYAEALSILHAIPQYQSAEVFAEIDYRGEVAVLRKRNNG